MNKKIIVIGFLSVFLLSNLASASDITLFSDRQKNNNLSSMGVGENIVYVAELWIDGYGDKSTNDCHYSINDNNGVIYLPHVPANGGEIDVTFIANYTIINDQSEFDEIWKFFFAFSWTFLGNKFVEERISIYDNFGIDDAQTGQLSSTITIDSSYVGKYVWLDLNVAHLRDYWALPDFPEWVNSGVITLKTFEQINEAPNKPVIEGPSTIKPRQTGTFKATSTDPESDRIKYEWDWEETAGIDIITDYYNSGETDTQQKKWPIRGTYKIKCRATDEYSATSEWSTFTVTVSRNRAKIRTSYQQLLERFLGNIPILQQLLNL